MPGRLERIADDSGKTVFVDYAHTDDALRSLLEGVRALGPRPFTSGAIKPAFARSDNLLAVVAADPETDVHSLFLLRPDGGDRRGRW